jgi:hypothetical protein
VNNKIRFTVLIGLAAAAAAIGFVLAPESEAGGGAIEVPLVASFRGLVTDATPLDRILGDEKGPYIHGVAVAGTVTARITKPARSDNAYLYMALDNGGDAALGRTVGLLFREKDHSCEIDGRKDSTLYMDFPVGLDSPLVKTKWVLFRTWREYIYDPSTGKYFEGLEIFDLLSMALNEIAYVGFSCNFRGLLEDGTVTDEYYLGYMWDPVEVRALAVDANGRPTQWAIRPIQDFDVYTNIQQDLNVPSSAKPYVPARMLLQLHTTGRKGYQSQCYGIWKMPFELELTRVQ